MLLDCSDREVQLLKKSVRFVLTQVPGVVDRDVVELMALEKKLNSFPVTLEEIEGDFIPYPDQTDQTSNKQPYFEYMAVGE